MNSRQKSNALASTSAYSYTLKQQKNIISVRFLVKHNLISFTAAMNSLTIYKYDEILNWASQHTNIVRNRLIKDDQWVYVTNLEWNR